MTEKKEAKKSVYERLSQIDVRKYLNDIKVEGKNKNGRSYSFSLSYLSWAKAWGLVKAIYPDASYRIHEYPNWIATPNGMQQAGTLDYRITKAGCEVEVTATIQGVDYTQKLYPMDSHNKPIMNPNIKDINKAQLRCLVKALATAGLGLNVYAGEDLPSNEEETAKRPEPKQRATQQSRPAKQSTAKANFKLLPIDELKTYSVMYKENADAEPKETWLSVIFTKAIKGDKYAQAWWKDTKKKLNTPEGRAVAQYSTSQFAKQIEKEEAVKKVKQHSEEKQEA